MSGQAFNSRKRRTVVRRLIERDGLRCAYCPTWLTKETLTIDHVIPRSRGGTNHLANLVLACGPCNKRKGAHVPSGAHAEMTAPTTPNGNPPAGSQTQPGKNDGLGLTG